MEQPSHARSNHRRLAGLAVTAGLLLVIAAAVPLPAEAATQLWLYPDGDDPRAGGHVVDSGAFTLLLENRGGGGRDTTAHDVFLVFSVEDPATLDTASLLLPDGTTVTIDATALQLGSPTLPCSGHDFPPHSVYPAHFTTVSIGDLSGGDIVAIGVDISGGDGLRAHFDAFGIGYRRTGPTVRCFDVTNPSGHDLSVVLGGTSPPPCEQLTVDKAASATGIDLGDEVDYSITVHNTGTCDLSEVVVVEDIPMVSDGEVEVPAFTVLVAEPPATSQTPDELVWVLGAVPAGASATIVLTVIFDEELADGTVVVNTVCASAAELEDPVCARARVAVGDIGDGTGGPGFWCNQIRFALEGRPNAKFTTAELESWLTALTDASLVFSELYDASSLELARMLICRPNQADSPADRLARHLLVLWFNVTSGRLDPETTLGALCSGSVPPPAGMDPEMTIAEVLAGAEADLVAGADDETLVFWAELIDFINNSRPVDDPGCQRYRRGRRRF